jgi:hypothetical protein
MEDKHEIKGRAFSRVKMEHQKGPAADPLALTGLRRAPRTLYLKI